MPVCAVQVIRLVECGDMEIRILANVALLKVEGRLDHVSAPGFEKELLPQADGCSGDEKRRSACADDRGETLPQAKR
jgi:hypothetical protein